MSYFFYIFQKKIFLTMGPKKVSDKPKGSIKLLTTEQKKEIISAYERGVRIVDLAAKHGIALSSIATILKKEEEIKAASVLHYWEEFQSLATKWHPNKAEMNRLCALVEDKCLNHFKNILKKKRSSINFGQIFDYSFSKETEASY